MSQFQRAANVSREVTSLLPEKIAQYALGKNLGGSFRVVSVADSITTTKGGKQNYGIVIAMSDGIADLTSWDAGAHQEWLRLASHGKGAMVHIQGMSCTKRSPLVQGFANGEWVFNVNKDTYKVDVLNGVEDHNIPVNGKVPPSWLRQAAPAVPSSPSSWSNASQPTMGGGGTGPCCSAPHHVTCRSTGNPHTAVCVTCRLPIDLSQPYCSQQTNRAKCSAQIQSTPQSPFRVVLDRKREKEKEEDDNDGPPPKVLQFGGVDDKDNGGDDEGTLA